ncbi:MAG: 30S ribosomal protein S20 [Clostridiales bacterium]|nr:30S ribosomal protein S20 [Clostridiales bacterium]MBQ4271014.1 30S ribosomal protein S20 [Clostridiales bacterium]MBR6484691.1 30S ribosomal protein S20 [Clostridiales bacterium]
MPNIKSAIKRVSVTEKKTAANKMKKSQMRTEIKKARASVASGENTAEALKDAQKTLDKAAQKGYISKNAAARTKSRLAKAAAQEK